MAQLFGYLGGLVSIFGFIPYFRDIFSGSTKPERASWLIWSVLGSIAFFSQLDKGATDSLWMTGVQTIGVLITFALSLKFGVGGLTARDVRALAAAGLGLLLWYLTTEAAFALFMVIFVDSIGAVLTVIKSYEKPESETLISWVFYGLGGFFALLAVGRLDFILLAYPLYIVLANTAVVAAILLGRKRFDSHT